MLVNLVFVVVNSSLAVLSTTKLVCGVNVIGAVVNAYVFGRILGSFRD